MNRSFRRASIGILSGAVASTSLIATLHYGVWSLILGVAIGAAYSAALRPTRRACADSLMAGGSLGVPLWGLISVIAVPLLSGQMPEWSAEQMRQHFPALVGWVVYGAFLGIIHQVLQDSAEHFWGPEAAPKASAVSVTKRIVILGGGFAGMRTAECLEEKFRGDFSVSIALVNETNALLFTPMLAEVAGSSLEPSHISTPLRSTLRRTEFIRGVVAEVDLEKRLVILRHDAGVRGASRPREVPYDHLIFALGSTSNYLGMTNIEKFAFNFKSLLDAIRIRNHVIEMFERADLEADPALQSSLLTFVIAGGGFAGVELAGALNDFAHGILADYPKLHPNQLNIVLVHSRDRILPELSESLARYAQEKMQSRGVSFRLNTRIADAQPGVVLLSDGEIHTETLVWTAGTAPNPLLKSLPLEKDKRGALLVDSTLALPGRLGLWAIGDCAAVTDAATGRPCPPTAQFALREAEVLASNIHAQLEGRSAREFHFDSLGALCVVGHQTACAELSVPFARSGFLHFSGLFAWLLWRGIYLAKLPGLERKIRVLMDWTIELFFPRDIVQTIALK
ncbi:MAG TPA: NAD(P)/FAD-dependent oxidoreductase [Candidatus Acidoferrum sp.]|nr:NAD(P)/FAD-dependent oxidoreductase [Candidatus Acidoferrum sp.]